MKLDAYQRDEFNSHYSSTFVRLGGNPLLVHGSISAKDGVAYGRLYKNGAIAEHEHNFNMEDIEHYRIHAGFYDDVDGLNVLCFSRIPITQVKRGIWAKNASFYTPKLDKNDLVIYNTQFTEARFIELTNQIGSPKKYKGAPLDKLIGLRAHWMTNMVAGGFALNKDYAIMYRPKMKSDRYGGVTTPQIEKGVLVGLGGPIGELDFSTGNITLHEPVQYLQEGIEEGLNMKFEKVPKINVR